MLKVQINYKIKHQSHQIPQLHNYQQQKNAKSYPSTLKPKLDGFLPKH